MILEPGMLVRSKAGHDKNCIYVIIYVKDEYVYLADGRLKTVCRTKRKNRRHVQPMYKSTRISVTDDEAIRNAVKKVSAKSAGGLICQKLT